MSERPLIQPFVDPGTPSNYAPQAPPRHDSLRGLHDNFLSSQAKTVENAARDMPGAELSGLSEGSGRTSFFSFDHDAAPLDLAMFGLPKLPEGLTPRAILIRSNSTKGPAIELISTEVSQSVPGTVSRAVSFVLEDGGVGTGDSEPKWTLPGNTKHGRQAEAKIILRTKTGNDHAKLSPSDRARSYGNNPVSMEISSGSEGSYTLIRSAQTHEEAKRSFTLSPQDQQEAWARHRGRQRFLNKLAGAFFSVSSLVSVGAAVGPSEAPQNLVVHTANDLVNDGKQSVIDGKPQAEASYNQATLDRTREAVQAYMSNDMQALDDIQKKYDYRSDWIKPEQLQAIADAKNIAEFEKSFNAIFPNQSISLRVARADLQSPGAKLAYPTESDLPHLKSSAQSIAEVLQTYDARLIQKTHLQIQLATDVKDSSGDAAAGLTYDGNQGVYIYLDVNQPSQTATAAHEWLHALDNVSRSFSGNQARLNPSSISPVYVGKTSYQNAGTKVGKYTVVARSYGRANSREDAATINEAFFSGDGAVTLDRSPRGEKFMNNLLLVESKYPGFTAKMLAMAKPKIYNEASALDYTGYALGELGQALPWSIPIGFLAAATLAAVAEGIKGGQIKRTQDATKLAEALPGQK